MANNNPSMPGLDSSGGLSFNSGQDYNGLADLDVSIGIMPPQVLPGADGSSNMGAFSQDVPLVSDIDSQFDGGDPFVDQEPDYDTDSQFDSMQGLLNDSHTEVQANEQMYASQVEQPFQPVGETSNPLNRG